MKPKAAAERCQYYSSSKICHQKLKQSRQPLHTAPLIAVTIKLNKLTWGSKILINDFIPHFFPFGKIHLHSSSFSGF